MATKHDLIDALSQGMHNISKEDASTAVNLVLECLATELARHNRIEIRGFGSLSVRKRRYSYSDKSYNTVYYRMTRKLLV